MDVRCVVGVLSLAHHVRDHSKRVEIVCAVKDESFIPRYPLPRFDFFSDRSQFLWNELIIHRRALVNRTSSMHRPLMACNKNDDYEGDRRPNLAVGIFWGKLFGLGTSKSRCHRTIRETRADRKRTPTMYG